MNPSRRQFLQQCGAASLGVAGLQTLFVRTTNALPDPGRLATAGFGPLLKDPRGLLGLPEGFSRSVFSIAGQTMTDGFEVPGAPDGTTLFMNVPSVGFSLAITGPVAADRLTLIRSSPRNPESGRGVPSS